MKTDRDPIELQFTANFLQIPERILFDMEESRQNGLLEALSVCRANSRSSDTR